MFLLLLFTVPLDALIQPSQLCSLPKLGLTRVDGCMQLLERISVCAYIGVNTVYIHVWRTGCVSFRVSLEDTSASLTAVEGHISSLSAPLKRRGRLHFHRLRPRGEKARKAVATFRISQSWAAIKAAVAHGMPTAREAPIARVTQTACLLFCLLRSCTRFRNYGLREGAKSGCALSLLSLSFLSSFTIRADRPFLNSLSHYLRLLIYVGAVNS